MDKIDCYVVPQTTGTGRNIFQGGSPLSASLPLLGVQLVLIVAVTRVLYFLLKPLKQPRVVSEIMARPPPRASSFFLCLRLPAKFYTSNILRFFIKVFYSLFLYR